jgi:hypothetical protein
MSNRVTGRMQVTKNGLLSIGFMSKLSQGRCEYLPRVIDHVIRTTVRLKRTYMTTRPSTSPSPFPMKTPTRKRIAFAVNPDVRHITPRRRTRKSTLNMNKKLYERFNSDQVTDEMLEEASKLFSENYGVWSERAAQHIGAFARAGTYAYT